jgi:hypothetical protein
VQKGRGQGGLATGTPHRTTARLPANAASLQAQLVKSQAQSPLLEGFRRLEVRWNNNPVRLRPEQGQSSPERVWQHTRPKHAAVEKEDWRTAKIGSQTPGMEEARGGGGLPARELLGPDASGAYEKRWSAAARAQGPPSAPRTRVRGGASERPPAWRSRRVSSSAARGKQRTRSLQSHLLTKPPSSSGRPDDRRRRSLT